MDDIAMLGKIRSRADFLRFLDAFQKNVQSDDVRAYLEAIAGWTADMDGYYRNSGQAVPQDPNWDFIATLLYAGSIYE